MTLSTYARLQRFRKYIPDWVSAAVVLAYFFLVAEHAKPFNRQFKLSDPTIQHPFAYKERVSGHECLFLAAVVPLITILVVTFIKHRNDKDTAWHVLQASLLGVAVTVSVDGVITDILKNWVGRPRPDFLERCGPQRGTASDVFVDITVCTAPLGERILTDGMRLTPLGHSLISFSAFLFLTMWLFGQYNLVRDAANKAVHWYILAASPLLLATYVALSRTQDYRHHFTDVISGSMLGCAVAVVVYHRYFMPVAGEQSDLLVDDDRREILPL